VTNCTPTRAEVDGVGDDDRVREDVADSDVDAVLVRVIDGVRVIVAVTDRVGDGECKYEGLPVMLTESVDVTDIVRVALLDKETLRVTDDDLDVDDVSLGDFVDDKLTLPLCDCERDTEDDTEPEIDTLLVMLLVNDTVGVTDDELETVGVIDGDTDGGGETDGVVVADAETEAEIEMEIDTDRVVVTDNDTELDIEMLTEALPVIDDDNEMDDDTVGVRDSVAVEVEESETVGDTDAVDDSEELDDGDDVAVTDADPLTDKLLVAVLDADVDSEIEEEDDDDGDTDGNTTSSEGGTYLVMVSFMPSCPAEFKPQHRIADNDAISVHVKCQPEETLAALGSTISSGVATYDPASIPTWPWELPPQQYTVSKIVSTQAWYMPNDNDTTPETAWMSEVGGVLII
jgi:hypothetical protein